MDGDDRRLFQVHANRHRAERARPLAAVVKSWLETVGRPAVERVERVAAVLDPVVDDEFRRHARFAAVRGSTLEIEVEPAEMIYPLRVQWVYPLLEQCRHHGLGHIQRLIFQARGEEPET